MLLRGKLTRITLEMAARPQGVSSSELARELGRHKGWAVTELRRQHDRGRLEKIGGIGMRHDPFVYRLTDDGGAVLEGREVEKETVWDFAALWKALGPAKF